METHKVTMREITPTNVREWTGFAPPSTEELVTLVDSFPKGTINTLYPGLSRGEVLRQVQHDILKGALITYEGQSPELDSQGTVYEYQNI